ncbi:MAG: redox-regulated ATPase YchF [candidate division WOR-3 bacterium]
MLRLWSRFNHDGAKPLKQTNMRIGILGLPNVGKSSLFNILTGADARVDLYPFTTIERNVGAAAIPDERLERIAAITRPQRVTPAHIDFVDIAGLVKGASQGEGLGNRFLAHVREADLLLHVVRAFSSPDIPHVLGTVDPDRDVEIISAELALADLACLERWLDHARKEPKSPERQLALHAAEKVQSALSKGEPVTGLRDDELASIRSLNLLALKPMLYAVNCSDTEPTQPGRFPRLAASSPVLFSAALELSMAGLDESEKTELREELGLDPRGPAGIVERSHEMLGLIRFYTIKGEESKAWSAAKGITAVEAAFSIHTEIGKGFIKAEVVSYADLVSEGDFSRARASGKVRIEGKNYQVQDGDVLLIRFRT